jgi:hypothetical protein
MTNYSGSGKQIKANRNNRVRRINAALNKAIRNWMKDDSIKNVAKVHLWQNIVEEYYNKE